MIQNLLVAAQATTQEPALVDGQPAPLSLNPDGRLRVASKQGYFPPTSGTLTAVNQAMSVDVTDASNVVLHVKNTGTAAMAAGQFIYEGSIDSTDGTDGTWFGLQAVRSSANTVESSSGTLSLAVNAGLAYALELSVNAVRWMRVRCTTAVTANSAATWTAVRGSYATEPIPAIQPHSISGNILVAPANGTNYALTTAATTNAAVIKATAGNLTEISVFNPTAAVIYVRLYNKATAPVVGTDIPLLVLPVPVNGYLSEDMGTIGKRFSAGIGIAVTAGPGNADAVAVGAGALISATHM